MNRILVIQTASIGDVILATPILEKLHHDDPACRLDLLVKQEMEGLFTGHPFLHELLLWDKKEKKFRNLFRLLRKIRETRYDRIINVQRFAATGFLTAFSGAGEKTGFSKNPFACLFSDRVEHEIGPGVHEVARNLRLLGSGRFEHFIRPRLYPSAAHQAKTAPWKTGNYYTIAPASLWLTKQYPAEKWVEFISSIPENATVYLLGSRDDIPLCERILRESRHPKAASLAGKLNFLESAALMKDARMNFTNDSAPMHLASAVNAPVTVVYCSTVPDFGFGPLSDDSRIVEYPGPLDCRPCGLHGFRKCPQGHFRCATGVDTSNLLSRL